MRNTYFRNITLIILSFLFFPSPLTAKEKTPAINVESLITDGISWELAELRKSLISDLRYNILFNIPTSVTEQVEGEETITLRLARKESVVLDFRESADKILEVKVNGRTCNYRAVHEHIVIDKKSLKKGENRIFIKFIAGNQSLNRREGYVYTLFVPDRARTVFPCFDQPNMKGRFTLSLDIDRTWKAVSNTYELDEKQGMEPAKYHDNKKIVRFAETEPLSTYLFAFAAGDFKYEKYTEDGQTIGAYYRETDAKRIAQLPEIMHQVVYSLKWQEEFTGMPYPFAKYDLVILPGFQFGGMEHTGATFYNDTRIFLPENPTQDELLARTELIAHETSHMWFGDAVTMNWFDDVWTKEVFANYFAAEITEPLFPDVDHRLNWQKTYVSAAMTQDRTEGRTSIRQPLDNMRFAGLIYNNIIYNKAPVMMRKMVALMGKDAFRSGIQEYLAKYKYSNATWDDLIAILNAKTPHDLLTFNNEWVDTPNWPERKATNYLQGADEDYYGFTQLTRHQADKLFHDASLTPAQRQCMMMTMYENYLRGTLPYETLTRTMYLTALNDSNALLSSTAIGYMHELMRRHPESKRIELQLWNAAQVHKDASRRAQIMRLLTSRSRTKNIENKIYEVWKSGVSPVLSENDFMTMAYELAVRMPEKADEIIATQRKRISNPDRQKQFDFISRAVSPSKEKRDSLFESFAIADNRRIEPWTLSALYYLNHPLRDEESVPYIAKALELLPDIQRTGDIFFPASWCSQLLAGHRCKAALDAVNEFLVSHPDLHPLLRSKILQAVFMVSSANRSGETK